MTILRSRFIVLFAGLGWFVAVQVSASLEDITYPIAELGNCASQEECFAYCDDPANFDACMAFADANDLLKEEEIEAYLTAEEALAQNGGPGGCTDQLSCEEYCSDVNNMEVCLAFASENGLMSEEELVEATKVLTALESGLSLPGGCTNEEECEAYCSDVTHMEECLAFASAAGLMSEEELEQSQKMLEIMESGGMPGGCTSEESCNAYCLDTSHMEECLAFGVASGFMSEEEAQQIRDQGAMMEDFVGPGGCDSEETCSAYCLEEVNREECETFFGEMGGDVDEQSQEGDSTYDDEYASTQETFSGPGGCTGEEECKSYCLDPANMDECASFFGVQPDEAPEDTQYDYEGDYNEEAYENFEGEYNEEVYDGYDEPTGFEGLTPEDIPLNLEGEYDDEHLDAQAEQYDEIEVTPESGASEGSDSKSVDGSQQEESADAGLMQSVRRFISRAVSQLML